MKRCLNAWLWVLVCVCSVGAFSPLRSLAQDQKRVVVLEFEGRGAGAARGHVLDALKARSEVEVVGSRDADAARQKLGVSWGSPEAYQKVGSELHVDAFVEGDVEKDGKRVRATVRVRDASTGLVAHEETWTRKDVPHLRAIEENFWQALGGSIVASSAPAAQAASAPEPTAEEPVAPQQVQVSLDVPAEEPSEQSTKPTSTAHPALVLSVGPRLMWRNLSYGQNTSLSSYENTAGSPAINAAVNAIWYPGAHLRSDWVSNFGIAGDLDYSMGLKSKLDNSMGPNSKQNSKKLDTTAYGLSVGLLYRLTLGAFELRPEVGYVRRVFNVDVPPTSPLPGVSYGSLRYALGATVHVADFLALDAGAAYLYTLSTGELGTRTFASGVSASALEFGGGISGFFGEAYGVRLGVDYQRYALDFTGAKSISYTLPKHGTDSYLKTTIAFVYRMGGVSR